MTGAIGMMFGNPTPAVVSGGGGGGTSYFNGATASSYLSGSLTAISTSDFTWETWMYLDNTSTGDRCIFDLRGGGGGFFVYYTPGSTTLTYHFGSGSTVTNNTLSNNAWNHIALVRTSGTVRMFVGGVYKSAVAAANDLTSTSWIIGAFYDGFTTTEVWKGYLDDMRLSNNIRYPGTTTFTPPSQLVSDANTNLLFNFNGTNGSTSFTEDGPSNRTVTRNGSGASLSSTQFKY